MAHAATFQNLIDGTLQYMDAEYSAASLSPRWAPATVQAVLNSVFDAEWSNILNAAPYYTFSQRLLTTDADGQIPFADMNSGSGDNEKNMYRILSINDGSVLYTETSFQSVPLATTTNYLPTYPRMYYVVGQAVQLLPVSAGTQVYVAVNYKPTPLLELASTASTIDFPPNSEYIIIWTAASQLLLKGGAESRAAADLKRLADDERKSLLDDIRRRTINPTRMAYPDQKYEWGGG
jgi:hypothetical protein